MASAPRQPSTSRRRPSDEPRRGWLSRVGPWAGIGTSPVAIMLGGAVAERAGVATLVIGLGAGVAGLVLLGFAQGQLGRAGGQTLLPLTAAPLGARGARFVAGTALLAMMLGWLGVNAGVAGAATAELLDAPRIAGVGLFVAIGVGVVWRGPGALSWSALAAAVATVGLCGYGLWLTADATPAPTEAEPPLAAATIASLVVGYGAAFAARTPDFTHDLERRRDVAYAAAFGLGAPLCLFLAAGVVLERRTGEWNLVDLLLSLDAAGVAYLILAIGIFGSVLTNLHSGALALSTVGAVGRGPALGAVAVVGGALAAAGADELLLSYLTVLALSAPGLAVLCILQARRGSIVPNRWGVPGLVAWALGFAFGLALERAGSPFALAAALAVTTGSWLLLESILGRRPRTFTTQPGDP